MSVPHLEAMISNNGIGTEVKPDALPPPDVFDKRISRVSRLRDMFQTGIIRPIEEIDDPAPSSSPTDMQNEHFRFLRTFPGSPPLSALRNHRINAAKNDSATERLPNGSVPMQNGTSNCNSHTSSPSNAFHSDNPCVTPPARPPKPRNLSLENISPQKFPVRSATPAKFKVSSELMKSRSVFENGSSAQSEASQQLRPSSDATLLSSSKAATPTQIEHQNLPVSSSTTVSISTVPEKQPPVQESVASARIPSLEPSKPLNVETSHVQAESPSIQLSPISAGVSDCENVARKLEPTSGSQLAETQARLSSWLGNSALDRIETTETSSYQDFIVQSDAFRVSPHGMLESAILDDSLPALQHAEPIAVATPDEDEDSDEGIINRPASPTPLLPVPSGLKVVSVDHHGVHILEDGNFFYSVPGLSSQADSLEDVKFLRLHSRSPEDEHVYAPVSTPEVAPISDDPRNDVTLGDSTNDSLSKHVRFSSEPMMVYSTHSVFEYNRRNEDIDPMSASAEYELEKHLEEMDLVNVELTKSPQGLGISILGLGVDNVGGDQKLGIFIKALTPNGAAEANGQIQVFDQIVEVDGVSLVGVSQQFAAQTLRGTREVVNFVLAREKDPANSRVAQLLAEQEEEEAAEQEAKEASSPAKHPSSDTGIGLPRDDSVETLHKMLADSHLLTREPVDSLSEEESGDDFVSPLGDKFDSSPLFALDTKQLGLHSSPTQEPDLSTLSNQDSIGGKRSALKGTATAASTKRRQDAINQLLQLAEERIRNASSPRPPSTVCSAEDRVKWQLASDLYDCHCQLAKSQSQLQSLEQRLTAQEAAADEAIERLCLQCRHVELELHQSQDRLKQYIQTHQNEQPDVNNTSTTRAILTNGQSCSHTQMNGVSVQTDTASAPASTSESMATLTGDPVAPPPNSAVNLSIWSSNLIGSDPAATRARLIEQTDHATQWSNTTHTASSSAQTDAVPIIQSSEPEATSEETRRDSPNLTRIQLFPSNERVRLISSGGLAQRRRPTRVMINPPPYLLPNSNNHPFPPTYRTSSVPSFPTSHLEVYGSLAQSNHTFTTASASLDDTQLSDPSHQSGVAPEDASTPTRSSLYKVLGFQLPGLTTESTQSVILRRRSSETSPGSDNHSKRTDSSTITPSDHPSVIRMP